MTFDIKKYPGYSEMIFRNRKTTLSRKKALATMFTGDNLEVSLYDFYNKYYFFMKFSGFDPMINIYSDQQFRTTQFDEAKNHYEEKFRTITINDIERIITETIEKKQTADINVDFVTFCNDYIKRKGLDVPETEPVVKSECHLIDYDENGHIIYIPQPMEDDAEEKKEEQNEITPLSFSEDNKAVVDDEWAGFPLETKLEELKPQDLTPEEEAMFEQLIKTQEVTQNIKADKKSKKKSVKKKKK